MEPVKGFRPVAINVGVHRDDISAFGFVVEDLDVTHQRAIAAGAKQHSRSMDQDGFPRHSQFADPSGNRIVLWQG